MSAISQKIWSDFFFPFTSQAVFESLQKVTHHRWQKHENQPKVIATFSKPGFHTPSTG